MAKARPAWRLLQPLWVLPLLAWAVSMGLAVLSHDWLERVENTYSDTWHQLAGAQTTPEHVSLVLIDEPTLNAYPDTPLVFWSPLFAQSIEVLLANGARLVGVDFLFSVSAERWLQNFQLPVEKINYDQPLRLVLSQGKTVLVAAHSPGARYDQPQLPIADLWFALPDQNLARYIGWANLLLDDDGTVRHMACEPALRLHPDQEQGDRPRLNFAALLSQQALQDDAAALARLHELCNRREQIPIRFAGPPHTVTSISMLELLQAAEQGPLPAEMRAKIEGRVIILAADAALFDIHATPYSTGLFGQSQWMAGAEIHANAVETLMSAKVRDPLPAQQALGALGLLLAGAALLFRLLSPGWGSLLAAALVGLVALAGYLAFLHDLQLPVAAAQLALLVCFGLIYSVRFVGEIRVRRNIEMAFGRYVSKTVVQDLMASGQMPQLGGETVEVTVLFSDIRNFTSISERLTSQQVVQMINTYFAGATQCVLNEQGNIDKFIGDAIMAEFGAPIHREDHALRAVTAAIKLIENLTQFRVWFRQHLPEVADFEFDIGIGLHTGLVTMGNIGTAQRTEYTALGDTVNAASRLEGATKETGFHIVASDATIQAAGPTVITGRVAQLQVKGRKEPLLVHEVLGLRPS